MLHIVFVTISMSGGGTERVIANLANYYVNNNHKTSIFMIGGDTVAYSLDERIQIEYLSGPTSGSIKGRIKRISYLREAINEIDNPIVIAMGTVASMFTSVATIGVNCRLIFSERNDPNRLNHRPIKSLEKKIRNVLYLRANKIVFQTDMAKDCFPQYLKRKSEIIMNPLSEDIPQYNETVLKKKRIVYAGRLTEQKNPLILVDAFIRLCQVDSDYTLLIFGDGKLRSEIVSRINDNHVANRVYVCGYSSDLYKAMLESEVFVSCSNWEGISNSLIEAAALGMKIIATDCPMGGSRMIVNMISCGMLVGVNSTDELFEALRNAIGNSCNISDAEVYEFREKVDIKCIAEKWIKIES